MTSLRTAVAVLGLGLLAATSTSNAIAADKPVPGALPPPSNDQTRAQQSQAPLRNSDNKPLDSRTGINSDPDNPNGVARPSTTGKGTGM